MPHAQTALRHSAEHLGADVCAYGADRRICCLDDTCSPVPKATRGRIIGSQSTATWAPCLPYKPIPRVHSCMATWESMSRSESVSCRPLGGSDQFSESGRTWSSTDAFRPRISSCSLQLAYEDFNMDGGRRVSRGKQRKDDNHSWSATERNSSSTGSLSAI